MAQRQHLLTATESLIGRGGESIAPLLAATEANLEWLAADILANADFDFDEGKCYIRYDGSKATVAGRLTQYGWEMRCECISASCVTPFRAFEMAVRMRIERNAAARAAEGGTN